MIEIETRLVAECGAIVKSLAWRECTRRGRTSEVEDVMQTAILGALSFVRSKDYDTPGRCFIGAVKKEVTLHYWRPPKGERSDFRPVRVWPSRMDGDEEVEGMDEVDLGVGVQDQSLAKERLLELVEQLPPRHRRVILSVFGLGGQPVLTVRAMRELGVAVEDLRLRLRLALRYLKMHHTRELKEIARRIR